MTHVENTSSEARVWPDLQAEDGKTLELAAGKTADIELPAGFKDPHLRVRTASKAKSTGGEAATSQEATP